MLSRHNLPVAPGASLIAAAALVGAVIAAWNFFAPMTGITGTAGAMLVLVSSLLLVLDGAILNFFRHGAVYWTFIVLGILGVIGTLAAALFLHAGWLMTAMVVVAIGIIVEIVLHASRPAKGAV